jgi:hypothetical protein
MRNLLILVIVIFLSSCARFPEEEVKLAKLEIESMYYSEIPKYMPEEWNALKDVWQKLDNAEKSRKRDEALRWYYYTFQKAMILDENLTKRKKEEEEKAKKQRDEAEKRNVEAEKARATAALAEGIKAESEIKKFEKEVVVRKKPKTMDDIRYKIEKRFPSFYTVKEEEKLEYIAEMPFVYSDKYQWPLIYKYNRNQIRDPKKLYKGQILKIPRNITIDEIYKAREEAGAANPRGLPKGAFTPDRYKRAVEELTVED